MGAKQSAENSELPCMDAEDEAFQACVKKELVTLEGRCQTPHFETYFLQWLFTVVDLMVFDNDLEGIEWILNWIRNIRKSCHEEFFRHVANVLQGVHSSKLHNVMFLTADLATLGRIRFSLQEIAQKVSTTVKLHNHRAKDFKVSVFTVAVGTGDRPEQVLPYHLAEAIILDPDSNIFVTVLVFDKAAVGLGTIIQYLRELFPNVVTSSVLKRVKDQLLLRQYHGYFPNFSPQSSTFLPADVQGILSGGMDPIREAWNQVEATSFGLSCSIDINDCVHLFTEWKMWKFRRPNFVLILPAGDSLYYTSLSDAIKGYSTGEDPKTRVPWIRTERFAARLSDSNDKVVQTRDNFLPNPTVHHVGPDKRPQLGWDSFEQIIQSAEKRRQSKRPRL